MTHLGIKSTPRELRVAVINYTGDRDNWGCRATSREFVGLLERSMPHGSTIKPVFVPLLRRRRVDRVVERVLGKTVLNALAAGRPSRSQRAALQIACRACYGDYLAAVQRCDYAFFQGEGTMTGEDFCTGARLLLLPHLMKVIFDVPVISINQTVYSTESAFDPVLQATYRLHDEVFVREPASLQFLHRLGLTRATLLPDTAFLTQPSDDAVADLIEPSPCGRYFCVSGTALFLTHGLSFGGLAVLINHVHQRWNLIPVMLCSTEVDRRFVGFLERWSGRKFPLHRVALERSHQQVARVLSGAEFLLSGRYHMSILAAVGATPVVMMETNTFKHHGLAELLQCPRPVRDYSEMDGVCADIQYVMSNRQELSKSLASRTRDILAMIGQGERTLQNAIGRAS